jgi:hypothetical protein
MIRLNLRFSARRKYLGIRSPLSELFNFGYEDDIRHANTSRTRSIGERGVVQYGGQPNETRTTGRRLRCLLKCCSLHFSFPFSPLLKLTGLGTRFKLIQHLQHLRRRISPPREKSWLTVNEPERFDVQSPIRPFSCAPRVYAYYLGVDTCGAS